MDNHGRPWRQADIDTCLRRHVNGDSNEAIGRMLGRSAYAIECRLKHHEATKDVNLNLYTEEKKMDSNKLIETITKVYGKPANECDEAYLIKKMIELQLRIEELKALREGMPKFSKKLSISIAEHQAALLVMVDLFDEL